MMADLGRIASGVLSDYIPVSPKIGRPDFVRRMDQMRAGGPINTIKNDDGTSSTHKMASGEWNGKYVAFPTIVAQNGKLVELPIKEAVKFARDNNEYLIFGSEDAADKYARGSWKKGIKGAE